MRKANQNTPKLSRPISLDGLYYQNTSSWQPVPYWAYFYLSLGIVLSNYRETNRRLIVAIAAPTNAFIVPLISAGVCLGRSRLPYGVSDQEHYETILSLPIGTPLYYRRDGRKKKALKRENQTYDGVLTIGIQIDEGKTNTTIFIKPENSSLIEVANQSSRILPREQNGRTLPPSSDLLKAIIGKEQTFDYEMRTRLECVIVGVQEKIKQEIEVDLKKEYDNCEMQGKLSGLLRLQKDNPPGIAYRSMIISSHRNICSEVEQQLVPPIVLFDGAYGFLKWNYCWPNSNWVVALDMTEPSLPLAVDEIHKKYAYRSESKLDLDIPSVPPGIEMMIFGVDK